MQRLEAPRAWPNKAIKCGGHGSVSCGDRRGSQRDQGRTGSNCFKWAQKQRANQSNFGPTCRLVSSPKAGPGATVGTLNQGYPLLQYEDTVPVRRSLAARRTAPDPAMWMAQGAPRGEKRKGIPGCTSWTGPPRGSAGPLYAQPGPPIMVRDSQVSMSGPLDGVQIPPSKDRATTRSRDRGYPGISKGPILTRVRPYPMRLRSPLRRRPAAAAWLVARDISRWAEPDVRPLKPHGLCIYCGEDAPPAHSIDRRCAPSAFNAPCPLRWQVVLGPSCRRRTCLVHCQTVRLCRAAHCAHHPLYEKLPLHADATQISEVRAQEDCSSSKH
jgi:hypothetical protein